MATSDADEVGAGAAVTDPAAGPVNEAAWIRRRRGPLEVGPAPYPRPGPGEIVVRTRAVAVNPLDWIVQLAGNFVYRWISYPFVPGTDLAGEVVEVGPDVTRFEPRERVLAQGVGAEKDRNRAAEGAFQHYSLVLACMAAPIPDDMAWTDAAVLPLGVSTAACALYSGDHLGLRAPSLSPTPTGETVIVWGGSTSVGSNAIQLAVASGYRVVTTCSPRNFDYVAGLGASEAVDYRSPAVVSEVAAAVQDGPVAGALAIGAGSGLPCLDILRSVPGPRVLALTSTPVGLDSIADGANATLLMARIGVSTAGLMARCRRHGVRAGFVNASAIRSTEVSRTAYEQYLSAALAAHRYQVAPPALIAGEGLGALAGALDLQRRGVSARKVVVALPD